jgi:hypothetical protein
MLSGPLSHLSPGNIAYLALALCAFFAFAVTLAFVAPWSDHGRPKSGRPAKTTRAVRPAPSDGHYRKAA